MRFWKLNYYLATHESNGEEGDPQIPCDIRNPSNIISEFLLFLRVSFFDVYLHCFTIILFLYVCWYWFTQVMF